MTPSRASAIAAWPLVRGSYGFVFRHIPLLIRLGWVWLLLAWLVGAVLELLLTAERGRLLGELLAVPLLVAFAVAWHRASLLGPGLRGNGAPRLGGAELRYFGILLGLFALFLLVLMLAGIVWLLVQGSWTEGAPLSPYLVLLLALLGLGLLFFGLRFVLVFPAIAIGDRQVGLRRSWQLTRGHGLSLFVGFVASCLPLTVLKYAIVAAAGGVLTGEGPGGGLPELAILMPLFLVLDFANTAAAVAFLSRAYEAFTSAARSERAIPSASAGGRTAAS